MFRKRSSVLHRLRTRELLSYNDSFFHRHRLLRMERISDYLHYVPQRLRFSLLPMLQSLHAIDIVVLGFSTSDHLLAYRCSVHNSDPYNGDDSHSYTLLVYRWNINAGSMTMSLFKEVPLFSSSGNRVLRAGQLSLTMSMAPAHTMPCNAGRILLAVFGRPIDDSRNNSIFRIYFGTILELPGPMEGSAMHPLLPPLHFRFSLTSPFPTLPPSIALSTPGIVTWNCGDAVGILRYSFSRCSHCCMKLMHQTNYLTEVCSTSVDVNFINACSVYLNTERSVQYDNEARGCFDLISNLADSSIDSEASFVLVEQLKFDVESFLSAELQRTCLRASARRDNIENQLLKFNLGSVTDYDIRIICSDSAQIIVYITASLLPNQDGIDCWNRTDRWRVTILAAILLSSLTVVSLRVNVSIMDSSTSLAEMASRAVKDMRRLAMFHKASLHPLRAVRTLSNDSILFGKSLSRIVHPTLPIALVK